MVGWMDQRGAPFLKFGSGIMVLRSWTKHIAIERAALVSILNVCQFGCSLHSWTFGTASILVSRFVFIQAYSGRTERYDCPCPCENLCYCASVSWRTRLLPPLRHFKKLVSQTCKILVSVTH